MLNKTLSRRSILAVLPFGAALAGLAFTGRAKAAEPQPHMQAALEALRTAQRELDAATPDKGGHRARAMVHTREAIAEVERGVAFDNRRP